MRRSMLKPITYSMCCQRPTILLRLATFALPDTAPTQGRANGCTSVLIVFGSNTVSPSIMTTMSCLACRMPLLSAAGLPALAWRMSRTFE